MRRLTRFLPACVALVCSAACADADPEVAVPQSSIPPGAEVAEQSGSLQIQLNPDGSVIFNSFSYAIVRPGFTKSGQIDVSKSNTVSTTLAGLPPATGYSLTLMGQSTSPVEANCSGSAEFDVTAGHVTQVPVGISCHVTEVTPPPGTPAVPIPPLAPVALGALLAALGAGRVKRRNEEARRD